MKNLLFAAVLLLLSIAGMAQKSTISGYIKDSETGEELIGVNVYVEELKSGTSTNVYGFYSLTLPNGTYHLKYSFLGFTTQEKTIELQGDQEISLELETYAEKLQEVEITAEAQDANVKSTEMSVVKMDVKEMKSLPVLFGEVDVMKTIQLMPGVQSGGEGSTGLYVRGGGPDQNLILLDEAPVYNASHLLGFFSVFNSDAVKDIKLYKGGIPAEYGGRLSSVLDVKMNEGNSKSMSGSGGIGLIASRLTLEGPVVKDKGSFIVSGRRTYADLFLKLSKDTVQNQSRLYFYDLNLKTNYKLGKKDRLFLSGYFGRDVFGFSDQFGFTWGNATGTLRWNHLFNNKLFLNTTAVFSNYDYNFDITFDDTEIRLLSGIQDYNIKSDLEYFPNPNNTVKMGVNLMLHRFSPPSFESNIVGFEEFKIPERYALESGAYIQNEQKFNERWSANYGLRYSIFNAIGPGERYTLDPTGEVVTDTTYYNTGEVYKTYHGLEPRVAVTMLINEFSSFKGSYNRTRQYIHLLSNSASSSPTDLWIPSGEDVKPQVGDQVALGYFRNFKDNTYETSIEIYGKYMQNLIDYKNGANITFNPIIENELLFGRGWSYGMEIFLQKQLGKLTGWIGYTLSRTVRQIDGINDGNAYPTRYDRTHDISVVATYKMSERLTLAGTWVYATGNAVTFPVGKYEYDGRVVSFYTERNGYRMPAYHRMDWSVTLKSKKKKRKFESSWNFAIYNVYARKNPFSITFRDSVTEPGKTEAVQVSLFGLIPSVTWNFKF